MCSVTIVIISRMVVGSVKEEVRAERTKAITVMLMPARGATTSVLVIVAMELVELSNCPGFSSDV